MPEKTTLVLGAGASCVYGYPTGRGLRQLILQDAAAPQAFAQLARLDPALTHTFFKAFELSATRSIDFFLARNMRYSDVGKAAIAHALLKCEDQNILMNDGYADDWYSYLVNFIAHEKWEEFDPSWLTIVTFNYDRSLETFLAIALENMYGKSRVEVLERLRRLQIHHVYGDLCEAWDWPMGLFYGAARQDRNLMPTAIQHAVKRLKVIPEGRDDDEILTPVREAIKNAERVAFLGFGFDEVNVRRLGIYQSYPDGWNPRRLVGSAFDLSDRERRRIVDWFVGHRQANLEMVELFDMKCEKMLHETLFLEGMRR